MSYIFNKYNFNDYNLYSKNNIFRCKDKYKANDSNLYNDVLCIFPSYKNNTFHSILAINMDDTIVTYSNSFLHDSLFDNPKCDINKYDQETSIVTRLNITYDYLLKNKSNISICIDETCYLLANPFNASNFGHDLSIILDRINSYINLNLDIPVILPQFVESIPRIKEVVEILLPSTKIILMEPDKIYKFSKLYVTFNEIFNILKHQSLINKLIDNTIKSMDNLEKYKNKKIIIFKNSKHANVVSKWNCFNAIDCINTLVNNLEWVEINPEILNIKELICYLCFAKKIITSYGAISYGNAVFFNPNAKRYFLCINNWGPYYHDNLYEIIHVNELNLDSIKNRIISIVEKNI